MPRGLYTKYDFGADLLKCKPRRNKSKISKTWSCRSLNEWDLTAELRAFTQQKLRRRWLFQCQWVLWTLQHSVWTNGLFLSILGMPKGMTCSKWRRHSTWNKKRGEIAETVHRGERLHCCRIAGMWMLETLQNWCVSKGTLKKIFRIQAPIASGPVIAQDEIRRIVCLRSVWYQSSRTSKRTNCKFPASFQKYKRM